MVQEFSLSNPTSFTTVSLSLSVRLSDTLLSSAAPTAPSRRRHQSEISVSSRVIREVWVTFAPAARSIDGLQFVDERTRSRSACRSDRTPHYAPWGGCASPSASSSSPGHKQCVNGRLRCCRRNPLYSRRVQCVDPSALALSLSSHWHSYIRVLFSSRFISSQYTKKSNGCPVWLWPIHPWMDRPSALWCVQMNILMIGEHPTPIVVSLLTR